MTQDRAVADDVTVVIPTVGRDLLAGCLRSIHAGTVWPRQLVVVDQSQDGRVSSWLEPLAADGLRIDHVRFSAQTGIAVATNAGLDRVRTRYLAITHDDCRVRREWLERLSMRVRMVSDAIVTGRVEPEGHGVVLTVVTRTEAATYSMPMIDRDVLFPANMAFPTHLLDRIGYFDEHPSLRTAGEDNDWGYRALLAGIPIVYDPEIIVGHLAWHPPSALTSLYRRYARGQGSFYGKYLRRGDSFIAKRAFRDMARAPWLVIRGAITGNRELLAMGLGEVTGLPPGILAGLRNAGENVGWPRTT